MCVCVTPRSNMSVNTNSSRRALHRKNLKKLNVVADGGSPRRIMSVDSCVLNRTKILLRPAAFYSCCIWPRELRQQVKWMSPATGGPPRPTQPKDFINTSYPLLSSLILNSRGVLPPHTHTHTTLHTHTPCLAFRLPSSKLCHNWLRH